MNLLYISFIVAFAIGKYLFIFNFTHSYNVEPDNFLGENYDIMSSDVLHTGNFKGHQTTNR